MSEKQFKEALFELEEKLGGMYQEVLQTIRAQL